MEPIVAKSKVLAVKVTDFEWKQETKAGQAVVLYDAEAEVSVRIVNTVYKLRLNICQYSYKDGDRVGDPRILTSLPQVLLDIVDVDFSDILSEYKKEADRLLTVRQEQIVIQRTHDYNSNDFVKFWKERDSFDGYKIRPSITLEQYINETSTNIKLELVYGTDPYDYISIGYDPLIYRGRLLNREQTERPYLLDTKSFIDRSIRFASIDKAIVHIIKKHKEHLDKVQTQLKNKQASEVKKQTELETIQSAFPELTIDITSSDSGYYDRRGRWISNRNTSYIIKHSCASVDGKSIAIESDGTFNFAGFRNLTSQQILSIIGIVENK